MKHSPEFQAALDEAQTKRKRAAAGDAAAEIVRQLDELTLAHLTSGHTDIQDIDAVVAIGKAAERLHQTAFAALNHTLDETRSKPKD